MRTPAQALRRLKRRKPGVYWYRTRRHLNPMRKETGYVGKARDLDVREKCHEGRCHHKGCAPKPWLDLVVRRRTIRLPWWLGFDFITLSLETLVILVLRPRYNVQKNPRPGKVGLREQAAQRRERDALDAGYRAKVVTAQVLDVALRLAGMILVLAGAIGWAVTAR